MGRMGRDFGMKSRAQPKHKTKCRLNNWAEYDRELVRRRADPLDPDTDDEGARDGGLLPPGCSSAVPDNGLFISNDLQARSDSFPAADLYQCGNVDTGNELNATGLIRLREFNGAPGRTREQRSADGKSRVQQ
jgi:hypothetical protein